MALPLNEPSAMRVATLVLALAMACGGVGRLSTDNGSIGTETCGSCGGTASLATRFAMLGVIVGSTVYGIIAQR